MAPALVDWRTRDFRIKHLVTFSTVTGLEKLEMVGYTVIPLYLQNLDIQANTEIEVNGVWMDVLGMSWGPVIPNLSFRGTGCLGKYRDTGFWLHLTHHVVP